MCTSLRQYLVSGHCTRAGAGTGAGEMYGRAGSGAKDPRRSPGAYIFQRSFWGAIMGARYNMTMNADKKMCSRNSHIGSNLCV